MAAPLTHPHRLDLSKYEHQGSKVIASTPDGQKFKVRCKCGDVRVVDRVKIRASRRGNRTIHCYDCVCKMRQAVAKRYAPLRKRSGGDFAPGKCTPAGALG